MSRSCLYKVPNSDGLAPAIFRYCGVWLAEGLLIVSRVCNFVVIFLVAEINCFFHFSELLA